MCELAPQFADAVRPELDPDPVGAVVAAHGSGSALALATSGTTGERVRRVVRSTESWWSSFDAYSELTGIEAGARIWIPGPLRATMNLFAAVHARTARACVVDDPAVATHACLTPAQLDRRGAELPSGCTVVVAGAALPAGLAARARRRGLRLVHYYGAAELSLVAAGTEELTAFPGVEIEIRDTEIWVRSPYACAGYLGPEGALRRDTDGWATVGDLGRLDEGVLTVLGRPDAVITAGATVPIAEVESALLPYAGRPIAVCGVPHPGMGALVTVALTDAADREPLRERARAGLAPSHRPRMWRVVDALPLTDAGKVDRAALVRELEAWR